jgi:hypothetical protein
VGTPISCGSGSTAGSASSHEAGPPAVKAAVGARTCLDDAVIIAPVWSVRICSLGTRASTRAVLDECCARQGRIWTSGAVRVRVEEVGSGQYRDWDPTDVSALERAVGRLPRWAIRIDAPDRERDEARRIVLAVLTREGGVALDGRSTHGWTAEEIATTATVNRMRFLDEREY